MRLGPIAVGVVLALATSCSDVPTTSPVEAIGPFTLELVQGDGQSALPGAELPNPLEVSVSDSRGRRVRGAIVNFRVIEGGGSTFAGVAITNASGIARERWTLGMSGAQRLEARALDEETGAAVTYGVFTATVIDAVAPSTDSVDATPNPAAMADAVSLSAFVSDVGRGESNITAAEYSVNGAAAVAMAPRDGAADSPNELFHANIPPLGEPGNYEVCVRGQDAAGNWSANRCVTVVVNPPPSPAQIVVTPTQIDFGTRAVGSITTMPIDVRNDGGLSAGIITLEFSSDAAPQFRLHSHSCPDMALPPNGRCTITLLFQPATSGPHSATVTVRSAHGGSVPVSLTGAGATQATLSISPSSHDYGTAVILTTPVVHTFTVTNVGETQSGPVTVAVTGNSLAGFEIVRHCGNVSLQPGAQCSVDVAFSPRVTGFQTATLNASSLPGGAAQAQLRGTGITGQLPAVQVTPASVDFGSVAMGQFQGRMVMVSNVGGLPASGLGFGITGSSDFTIAPVGPAPCALGITLSPGMECSISLSFTPSVTGTRTASLVVQWSGGELLVPLSGFGTQPQPQGSLMVPPFVNFGGVASGATAQVNVQVVNSGAGPTGLLNVSIGGVNPREFTAQGCQGVSLASGASCVLTLRFAPTFAGPFAATATISGPTTTSGIIQLSGTGLAP